MPKALEAHKRRAKALRVYLQPAEAEEFARLAEAAGLSASTLARKIILAQRLKPGADFRARVPEDWSARAEAVKAQADRPSPPATTATLRPVPPFMGLRDAEWVDTRQE